MKINVCDVCHAREEKIVVADYRVGYKGKPRLDVCKAHKDILNEEDVTGESFLKWFAYLGQEVPA